jgi:hypothetical protein
VKAGAVPRRALQASIIGNATVLANWRHLQIEHAFHGNAGLLLDVCADFLTALAGFGLFFLRPGNASIFGGALASSSGPASLCWSSALAFRPSGTSAISVGSPLFSCWQMSFDSSSTSSSCTSTMAALPRRHLLPSRRPALELFYHAAPLHTTAGILPNVLVASSEACILGMLLIAAHRRTFGASLLVVPYSAMFAVQVLLAIAVVPTVRWPDCDALTAAMRRHPERPARFHESRAGCSRDRRRFSYRRIRPRGNAPRFRFDPGEFSPQSFNLSDPQRTDHHQRNNGFRRLRQLSITRRMSCFASTTGGFRAFFGATVRPRQDWFAPIPAFSPENRA